jgi:hypothetical protein
MAVAYLLIGKVYPVDFLAKCSLHEYRQVRSCRVISCAVLALEPLELVLILLAFAILVALNTLRWVPQHPSSFSVRDMRRWDSDLGQLTRCTISGVERINEQIHTDQRGSPPCISYK